MLKLNKTMQTSLETSRPKKTLPPALDSLVRKLRQRRDWRPAELVTLLRESHIGMDALKPWADFDHSPTDSYGRKMIFQGGHFEIMVMSWRPGDFSAIHDHGSTQWGAVKVFGPAEHATFRLQDRTVRTLKRWRMRKGDVVGVAHDLLHQMGNPTTDQSFISLHVYGMRESHANITASARLMELYAGVVQRVDGGVFFALPPARVESEEPGLRADFPTRLRHLTELYLRLRRMEKAGLSHPKWSAEAIRETLTHPARWAELQAFLAEVTDDKGFITDRGQWDVLQQELKAAGRALAGPADKLDPDRFDKYAEVYDKIIGQPCLDAFTARYLAFFQSTYGVRFRESRILSLGVGTGLTESYLIDHYDLDEGQILGIDSSEAMVNVAGRRVHTLLADLLEIPKHIGSFDLLYSGLNVLQYLPEDKLEAAIAGVSRFLNPGGFFIGDFISPDHIRAYPNFLQSVDGKVVSLRSPILIEDEGTAYQESSIINVDRLSGRLHVHHAGRHRRHLPSLALLRELFQRHFGPGVDLYDAYSLERLPDTAESSPSTRFLLIAEKAE